LKSQNLNVLHKDICPICGGEGVLTMQVICETLADTAPEPEDREVFQIVEDCEFCGGTGKILKRR